MLFRSLGMTKRQCILSLLGGIVVLTLVCSIVGATVGMSMNRVVQEAADNGEDSFSSAYTKGILEDSTEKGISLENNENMWGMVCLVVVCETGLVGVLALFFINQNLCIEPIRVLSAKGDE